MTSRVSLTIFGENDKVISKENNAQDVSQNNVNNNELNAVSDKEKNQEVEKLDQMNQQIEKPIEQLVEQPVEQPVEQQMVQPMEQEMNQQMNQLSFNDQMEQEYNSQMNYDSQLQSYNQSNQFYNSYINDGINIIDPNVYSPMVYIVDQNKMVYSDNSYPYIYNIENKFKKNSILPYAYISRNSAIKPDFDIKQSKLNLYNYWINTTDTKKVQNEIIKMFGIENIYITKSLFFRKKNSYTGEKVILINKLPQKPYKFINRLNRTLSNDRRTIKSVLGDYVISPDCIFIILAEKSIDYICNNYLRYHKEDSIKIISFSSIQVNLFLIELIKFNS